MNKIIQVTSTQVREGLALIIILYENGDLYQQKVSRVFYADVGEERCIKGEWEKVIPPSPPTNN